MRKQPLILLISCRVKGKRKSSGEEEPAAGSVFILAEKGRSML